MPKILDIPKKEILAPTQRAMKEYDMIKDGNKVLVAVSGGKDSLSLLHTLLYLKSRLPFKFEIGNNSL